jgi:hypothetical protein
MEGRVRAISPEMDKTELVMFLSHVIVTLKDHPNWGDNTLVIVQQLVGRNKKES